jgi:selenocysteine lyase/cysteine desulfurase
MDKIEAKGVLERSSFDPIALGGKLPGPSDPRLHYLDSAAAAQMPEFVLSALRRFEAEARANVHEARIRVLALRQQPITGRERARRQSGRKRYPIQIDALQRAQVARVLGAKSGQAMIFSDSTTSSINLSFLWHPFKGRR